MHAEILHVSEIHDRVRRALETAPTVGSLATMRPFTVRVVGEVREIDLANNRAVIEHAGQSLALDIQHLPSFAWDLRTLIQVLGDVELGANQPQQGLLVAQLVRNVSGMDLELFDATLKIMRRFQAEQFTVGARTVS